MTHYRTHTNGQLRKDHIDQDVKLSGWVHSRRDHGGIIFIDLRDKYGLTQIVFDPQVIDASGFAGAEKLRREDVVTVSGKVRARGEGLENPNLDTGAVEVFVTQLDVQSTSQTPPIEIDDAKKASDDLRLEYRYLDLRRPEMQRNMQFRSDVIKAAREYMYAQGVTEIETPILIKSTPEGARDYVVPSRVNKGKFYALPQSPQLYKQMLMVAGCDRYFQIARCLRDEDLRSDRQPEHTQMDFELSFVSQEDIREFVEGYYKAVFKATLNVDLQVPFQVLSYAEAMDKYGSDKPDLRYDLALTEVSEIVRDSDFGVFKTVVDRGGMVKCINPPKDIPRKEIDRYIEFCQSNGAKGMAWMRVTENGLESNIAKFFSDDIQKQLIEAVGAKPGSVLMFIADSKANTNAVLDKLRRKLADDLELYDKKTFKLAWINDFPLFAWNEDEKRWEAEHHMFSMPKQEFVDTLDKEPGKVLGDLWDITMNGWELGSGSIRVSNPEVQQRIMNVVGFDPKEAEEKFGFLLKAYQYGGPVHGGMGLGMDRLIALMLGYLDIREVMAFPKNKNAQCPMDGSPSAIDAKQLDELHLVLKKEN